MGLFDKLKKSAPQLKEKASDLAAEHHDTIDQAIDKAADAADKVTGGKHAARIDQASDKAKDAVDKLGDQK